MADAPDPPAETPLRCGAIVLAAGASQRLGQPKQLLVVEGEPLLVRTVRAVLASPVWPVVVVLGAHAETLRPLLAPFPVLVIENAAWPEGMAASLRAGVTTLRQFSRRLDAGIVCLCDQPAFSAAAIDALLAAQRASGRTIAAARYGGRLGAPALFLARHFDELAHLTGEAGARALLDGSRGEVAAVDLPALAVDLDTPADVAAWQASARP